METATPPLIGTILITSVCTIGLAGSSLIFYQYVKCRALRNPSILFIINLALADMGVLLSMIPAINNMVAHEGRQGYGQKECVLQATITIVSATSSLVTMGLIAISRYVAIVHPQKKFLLSWSVCCPLCMCSILLTCPALLGWGRLGWLPKQYSCTYDWSYNITYNAVIFIFAFGLVSLAVCWCYFKIYKTFRNSKRRVAGDGAKAKGISRDELRLAIQLLVVFVIYNICWSPYLLVALFIDPHGKGPQWLYVIIVTLAMWNSAVNVLVYLCYNRVFRAECLKLVGVKKATNTSMSHSTASTRTSSHI